MTSIVEGHVEGHKAHQSMGGRGRNQSEQIRASAEEALTTARLEAETIKRKAYEEGWQEGNRDGLLAAEESCTVAIRSLGEIVSRAQVDRASLLRNAEAQLVDLALAIARQVVEREITLDQDAIVPMVRAALGEIADATSVRVRVHPDHISVLAERWPSAIEFLGDGDLALGDCVVEAGGGVVDGRVETKLEEIGSSLREVREWTDR